MADYRREILLTVAYSNIFSFPLRVEEIARFLIQKRIKNKNKFLADLEFLLKKKILHRRNGYYFLSSLNEARPEKIRRRRWLNSRRHRQQLSKIIRVLAWIGWIEAIFLTGSVAHNNAQKQDDIDLLVVTRRQRIWLVRPLVALLALLFGQKRSWRNQKKGGWCFNLWLEEGSLAVLSKSFNFYYAFEIATAELLWQADGVGNLFYQKNCCYRFFLPNFKISRNDYRLCGLLQIIRNIFKFFDFWLNPFLGLANYLFYLAQHFYMKPHQTRERVGVDHAFFHPRDTRSAIFQRWKKILRSLIN